VLSLPSLCAIVDADVATRAGLTPPALAHAYLLGGAKFLQLRAKHAASGEWLAWADAIAQDARAHDARLIVNDRIDIALLANVPGLHLGQDDMPAAIAREQLGADAIIGLSTHTPEQIDAAIAEPISYLAIGPVFGTSTKETGYDAIGLERVRAAVARASARHLPVVAIGGITLDRAASVLDAGAASVAVITDLLATRDPEQRVRDYLQRLAERKAERK
jgi:thiamine-phosphate pyrophosphorylase